ncbi:MAG: hypothetical protein ACR2OG_10285 [Gemmatimonadaceae bacterium]
MFRGFIELAHAASALRLNVEIYEPDVDARQNLIDSLGSYGFTRLESPRSYAQTVLIDLRPPEHELLTSFHPTCRKNIKAFAKHGLQCLPVNAALHVERLNELVGEAMSRTGGDSFAVDWMGLAKLIETDQTSACLLGAFRCDVDGPEALIGIVLGLRHGDVVEYSVAASARVPEVRAPLLYEPTWSLFRWAKKQGASWFDFGGVTLGSKESGDPLGGISDFKRYFSANVVEVGAELVYTPSNRQAVMARWISRTARAARKAMPARESSGKRS